MASWTASSFKNLASVWSISPELDPSSRRRSTRRECIRRHYLDKLSPLSDPLARYADFFGLFDDFAGYVDFFHLRDLVNEGTATVKFFMPLEDFTASPLPGTLDAYFVYRQRAIEFIESRNRRIAAHVGAGPPMNSAAKVAIRGGADQ